MAGKADKRADKEAIILARLEVVHERAVDLDEVDRNVAQCPERGVSRTKIIKRDPDAKVMHAAHDGGGCGEIADQGRFRNLDRQPPGFDPVADQGCSKHLQPSRFRRLKRHRH